MLKAAHLKQPTPTFLCAHLDQLVSPTKISKPFLGVGFTPKNTTKLTKNNKCATKIVP